jgi:Ca2+-binding RTX toxin-like protein
VSATVSTALSAHVEALVLAGAAAIDGTGNELANVLTGNAAANVLDGGAGDDAMAGGAGDDTYIVDAAGDVVVEQWNEGTDEVQSAISYTLGDYVERLTLLAGASAGTGNWENNVITGNAGANTLDGGWGADTLAGGEGDDTYHVDQAGDVVVELPGQGADHVICTDYSAYSLAEGVENLTLVNGAQATGNSAANLIVGNGGWNQLSGLDGNDTLEGAGGMDTLIGGAGDDTYIVSDASAIITELPGQGSDTVLSAVTFALAANVEHLTLTGSDAANATGNAGHNVLTGNAAANWLAGGNGNDTLQGAGGNDTLNGGAGIDSMLGGAGDDLYYVDSAGDVVAEGVGNGTDTVQSTITFGIGANVENLTLTGTAAIDATGNSLAN